jgi:hypothetical protein
VRTAAAFLLLLAIATGLYWKLTLTGEYTWLENPDQALQVRPWLDFEARELQAGRVPLWDPYQIGGQPLLAQVQPGLANPLNWPLFLMPLRDGHIPVTTLHWYWVLIRWIAAVFAWLLCRSLGASWWASILGGCVFAYTGFLGHAGTPQFAMSAVWLPLVLLFFARVWRGEKSVSNAAWCGAMLGLQFLSGHHNIPVYTAIVLGALWLWRLRSRRMLAAAAVFAAVFVLVPAVQVLPAVEYGKRAVRWSGAPEPQRWKDKVPYSVHREYSLGAQGIPGMLVPGIAVHANSFTGVVALSLAIAAAVRRWRDSAARLLLWFALGGLVLALGAATPVQRLLYNLVPMVDKARYPAMCIALFQAALAPLAALGLDELRRARAHPILPGALVLVAAALLAQTRFAGHPVWVVAAAAVALAVTVFFLRAAPVLILALFVAETAMNPPPVLLPRNQPDSFAAKIASQSDIAEFLKRQPGWFRLDIDDEAVPYNFGDWHGLEQFGGYLASMPVKTHQVLGHLETPRQFGIRYRVGRKPANPGQVEVFTSRSGLKVWMDPAVAEPLWTVRDSACATPDRLRVVSRNSGEAVFDARLNCPGMLAAGDPWYTGWRAWVNGRPTRVMEVEGTVRGVLLPAGTHRVRFAYRPGSVYWGAALSLLGWVLAAWIERCARAQLVPEPG